MNEALEYYEYDAPHLSDDEALDRYGALRRADPNALVVLKDLECGHWSVKSFRTDDEKEQFLRKRLTRYVDAWLSIFTKR